MSLIPVVVVIVREGLPKLRKDSVQHRGSETLYGCCAKNNESTVHATLAVRSEILSLSGLLHIIKRSVNAFWCIYD